IKSLLLFALLVFLNKTFICNSLKAESSPSLLIELSKISDRVDVAEINGFRVENEEAKISSDDHYVVPADKRINIRLFGDFFNLNPRIGFTNIPLTRNSDCNELEKIAITRIRAVTDKIAVASVELPSIYDRLYICVDGNMTRNGVTYAAWVHQGSDSWMTIEVKKRLMPIPVQISLIVLCLLLCSLFSGLNLGLMALDLNELQVISSCGTDAEKRYAKMIKPVRKHGNYLLCTLLFSNVLVNSIQTVLLENLTSGLIAVIGSTLSIVIIGEIIPQSICSRHGLAVGANTIYLTYFFMILTFPMSLPISLILDKILGKEIGNVYDRERLTEYLRVTKDYNKIEMDEVNIIKGALRFKKIKVSEVMTNLEDVFMLPHNAILDFHTMSEIQKRGFSRIPIYEGERKNIIALLFARDLAFVDPDDKIPLKMVTNFYKHPLIYVFDDVTLDIVLNEFKEGRSHLAIVRKIYLDTDSDPRYEVIGIVTLEDVIEEVLQVEIMDETDTLTDNRRKMRRKEVQAKLDFSDFAGISEQELSQYVVSSQLAFAAYQYILTSVKEFNSVYVSNNILRRVMAQKIYFQHIPDESDRESNFLYKIGEPADYFILILEGKVRVTIGKEQLVFDCGPFNHFGASVLSQVIEQKDFYLQNIDSTLAIMNDTCINLDNMNIEKPRSEETLVSNHKSFTGPFNSHFVPDFSVEVVDTTTYMKITSSIFEQALKASMIEKESEKKKPDYQNL
ncbi:metal transporter CNNM4-like protein, partial [Dinothrombium tinctorium]